jgi:hypothetical protein
MTYSNTHSNKFKGGTLSLDNDEIGTPNRLDGFDILKDARELNGMRIILLLRLP